MKLLVGLVASVILQGTVVKDKHIGQSYSYHLDYRTGLGAIADPRFSPLYPLGPNGTESDEIIYLTPAGVIRPDKF